ncbi:MAG: FAD-binding protein [Coriobacteriales bacterium]|jgi:succinate dehydrogenase/fumarate reductase flavoprotein subunit|nr:FAD-binding protein [Coriobacteriales bacterium]
MGDLHSEQSAISRKDFLRGSAVAGLGAVGLGILAACSPGSGKDAEGGAAPQGSSGANIAWDKEVDVLVVGSGTAAYAALVAKGNGAENVLVIEKSVIWGGTSGTSGGTLWIPLSYTGQAVGMNDTREEALAYMKLCAADRGNIKAMEAYIDNGNALLEWTRDTFGWEWGSGTPGAGFKDYYEPYQGYRSHGRQVDFAGGGAQEWLTLQEELTGLGVEIMLETPATALVQDETGAVIGVEAQSSGKAFNIKASTCVVLGTGGFDHNPEMVAAFQSIPIYVSNAVQTNTGDGHAMGQAIGAQLANMDTNWGLPSFIDVFDPAAPAVYNMMWPDWGIYRSGAGSIIVNKQGRRFANESSAYAVFNRAFGNYDTGTLAYLNTPAVFICDSKYAVSGLPGGAKVNEDLPSILFKADSLAQIAEHFGIDAAALEDEVATFNASAEQGFDPAFHRGEKEVDRAIGAYHPYATELANPVLAPVATAPFYAALYVPGTCGTNGGLRTNEFAQVLTTKDEVIPHLYAVGNCTASISGGQYCGAGMTVGAGAVMSYIGVRKALGLS